MKALETTLSASERVLTHALLYDGRTNRWSCKCGYVLGDGHHALYALCPLSHRDKVVNQQQRRRTVVRPAGPRAYSDFKISSPTSQTAQQLFDLS